MNKCIRCGDHTDKPIIYKESKNIYYGEYICYPCNLLLNAEWDFAKVHQLILIAEVKRQDISVKEFISKSIEEEFIEYKNMLAITGDKKEAFNLMRNNQKAFQETEDYKFVENELIKLFGDEEE